MALFIIDFDDTITSVNTHNAVTLAIMSDNAKNTEEKQRIFKLIPPIRTAEEWQAVFETLYNDGHQIAIASFNDYGEYIPYYLSSVLGLPEDVVKKIKICSWMPAQAETANKNPHIEQIINETNFTASASEPIVLVDDSQRNINAAQDKYITIKADRQGTHLPRIIELSRELTPLSSNSVQLPPLRLNM